MSLRPALFNLWPSPWPEDCEHAWNMVYGMWDHYTYHCYLCNTSLPPLVTLSLQCPFLTGQPPFGFARER